MIFKTVKEYDDEIYEITNKINKYSKYVEQHPEKFGVKGNIKVLKHIREELRSERNELVNIISNEEIDLHLSGEAVNNHSISTSLLVNIINSYEEFCSNIIGALKFGVDKMDESINKSFRKQWGWNIKAFAPGSFMIRFSPTQFNDQTILSQSLNKQSVDILCELINCGENVDAVLKRADKIGDSSIIKYKEFIKIFAFNNLDMVLEDKNNSDIKVYLKHDNALEIYQGLADFNAIKEKIEKIEVKGILYYMNTENKQCGIKFYDDTLDTYKKITFSYGNSFKSKLKDKLDSEIEVVLTKTTNINISKSKKSESVELSELC